MRAIDLNQATNTLTIGTYGRGRLLHGAGRHPGQRRGLHHGERLGHLAGQRHLAGLHGGQRSGQPVAAKRRHRRVPQHSGTIAHGSYDSFVHQTAPSSITGYAIATRQRVGTDGIACHRFPRAGHFCRRRHSNCGRGDDRVRRQLYRGLGFAEHAQHRRHHDHLHLAEFHFRIEHRHRGWADLVGDNRPPDRQFPRASRAQRCRLSCTSP